MLTGKKTLSLFLLHIALFQISVLPQTFAQQGGQATAGDHFSKGLEHQRAGRFAEAVESYRRAVQLKPDLAEAHFNMGMSHLMLRQPQEALSAYKHYAEFKTLDPTLAKDLLKKIENY